MADAIHEMEVVAPDETIVQADEARLQQALENVVSNARTHAPAGTAIRLQLTVEEREGVAWVVLSVQNAGPGIPPAVLARLFERFSSGPGSSGLGLRVAP